MKPPKELSSLEETSTVGKLFTMFYAFEQVLPFTAEINLFERACLVYRTSLLEKQVKKPIGRQ